MPRHRRRGAAKFTEIISMNIKKLRTIAAKGDVFEIDIDIFNADMEMVSTEKPALFIQFSKGFRPTFKERDGKVSISQKKTLFGRIKRPSVTVYVPECTVPDANINMHCGSVTISGGIYNDVTVRGGAIKAAITAATFENLHINADELDVSADDITVKNIANAIAHDGRVEIDKAYCKKAECRVKRGNIGICSSTCDFAVLNSGEGNIAASMLGRESDYLVARNGDVSERENASSDKCIKACAAKGSVVIDFENAPRFNEAEELGYEQVGA